MITKEIDSWIEEWKRLNNNALREAIRVETLEKHALFIEVTEDGLGRLEADVMEIPEVDDGN